MSVLSDAVPPEPRTAPLRRPLTGRFIDNQL